MKISTNSIGNYTPNIKPKTVHNEKFNIETNQNLQVKNPSVAESSITQEEKDFFMGLYPQNTGEIDSYHFYHKSGKMAGIILGSQIDRRG
ncbi:MAG: hypothetical protein R6W90_01530 [Ignavibacteriaceae bacterium]